MPHAEKNILVTQGMDGNFYTATLFGCMDGRAISPVKEFVQNSLPSDGDRELVFDKILHPGIDGVIANGSRQDLLAVWKENAELSVKHHNTTLAIVAGHYGCSGNRVEEVDHRQHVARAVGTIASWNLFRQVIGVFVTDERDVEVAAVYAIPGNVPIKDYALAQR